MPSPQRPKGRRCGYRRKLTGEELAIAVIDRGPGLPAVAAEVLTGRSGAPPPLDGGGFGLWTISRLVADIGGQIVVEYPVSGGTAVKLEHSDRTDGVVQCRLANV